ncbi:MAG: hypothetical protein IJK47_00255 [Lachnospiraceae bacterium]|nr:hypothetical protein [Lachnospiraceae bacterium]
MKTMDLSKEKSMMEHFREAVPSNDAERKEKLECLAQQYMIYAESQLDPEELKKKFEGKKWKNNFDMQKSLHKESDGGRISAGEVLDRIKSTMNDIPETEEEKKTVKENGADVLLANARQGCYNYSATATRDEAQLQILQNRKNGDWLKNRQFAGSNTLRVSIINSKGRKHVRQTDSGDYKRKLRQ